MENGSVLLSAQHFVNGFAGTETIGNGRKLRLGNPVKVLVKQVDLVRRQLDFELVEE